MDIYMQSVVRKSTLPDSLMWGGEGYGVSI